MQTLIDWLNFFLGAIWTAFKAFLETQWALIVIVVGWIFAALTVFSGLLTDSIGRWTGVRDQVPNLNLGAPTGVSDILAICNTFFPLNEVLAFLLSYGLLLALMMVYRFFKTMLPGETV